MVDMTLIKRSGQASPLTAEEFDANMTTIENAFASITPGTGTVTSVGLSMPAMFSVANSPVTTIGTLAVTLATQTANTIFSGPTTGSAAAPTFRALVAADIPSGIALTKLSATTASRALQSNGSGVIEASSVTSTELSYVSGVTSAIQTQLNAKEPTITTLAVNRGGTGANTAQGARLNLLPSITGNALKVLRVNAGATDTEWVTAPSSGVSTVNSLAGALTVTSGTSGTDVNVSSAGTTITINVPSASATNRGVVTTGAQTIAGQKTFSSAPIYSALDTDSVPFLNSGKVLSTSAKITFDGDNLSVSAVYDTASVATNSNYSILATDSFIYCEQAAAIQLTLPLLADVRGGKEYTIKDVLGGAASKNITIRPQSGEVLENVLNGTVVLATNYNCLVVKAVDNGGSLSWIVKSKYPAT